MPIRVRVHNEVEPFDVRSIIEYIDYQRNNDNDDEEEELELPIPFRTIIYTPFTPDNSAHIIVPNLRSSSDNNMYSILSMAREMSNYAYAIPGRTLTGLLIEDFMNQAADQSDRELRRKDEISIHITTQKYSTTEKNYDLCTICTESFHNDDLVTVLNCAHIFHPNCIIEWGHYNPHCPVCKQEIPYSEET